MSFVCDSYVILQFLPGVYPGVDTKSRRGRGRLVRGQLATNRMTMLCMGDVKRKAGVRSTLNAEATRKPWLEQNS